MIVSTTGQDEFGVSLAPIHSIDTLRMYSIDHNYGPFLVSEVPDLQFIALLIIEGHCDLGRDRLAPANRHVSLP